MPRSSHPRPTRISTRCARSPARACRRCVRNRAAGAPPRRWRPDGTAAEAGVPLQVGYWRRFVPSLRALHDEIRGGAFGAVQWVHCFHWDERPPPAAFRVRSGGIMIDMGVHEVDMTRWLTGEDVVEAFGAAASIGSIHRSMATRRARRSSPGLAAVDCYRPRWGADSRPATDVACRWSAWRRRPTWRSCGRPTVTVPSRMRSGRRRRRSRRGSRAVPVWVRRPKTQRQRSSRRRWCWARWIPERRPDERGARGVPPVSQAGGTEDGRRRRTRASRGPGRVTVRDVAEAAGVSTATVTRALQGHPAVRDETRARVEAAVRRLDYQPDHIARALVTVRRAPWGC